MAFVFDPGDRETKLSEHQAEVGRLMACVEQRRHQLADVIQAGLSAQQIASARETNRGMPGVLGESWKQFLALAPAEQVLALQQPRYQGMSWQSLLQCNPLRSLLA